MIAPKAVAETDCAQGAVAIQAWDFFGMIFSGSTTPYALSGIRMQLGAGGMTRSSFNSTEGIRREVHVV